LLLCQEIGNGFADHRVSRIGHVTVITEPAGIHGVSQYLGEFFGRRHIGIAKAEVEHILGTVLGFENGPFFKHLANPGLPGHHAFDLG